jgi:serine/threonine protein kinase
MDEIVSRFPELVLQLSDFNLERPLPPDGCSGAYFAQSFATGGLCLVRALSAHKLTDLQLAAYKHQISVSMGCSSCPFLVGFLGFTSSPPYCLIYDLPVNGSLSDMIQNHYHLLTPTQKSAIAFGIAVAMDELHRQGIVHGDLGLQAVFLDENFSPRICPTGASYRIGDDLTGVGLGHPSNLAPEVLVKGQADMESDIYSYGVLLWELWNELRPFGNCTSVQLADDHFRKRHMPLRDEGCPIVALMRRCTSATPRPTMADILSEFRHMKVIFPGSDELPVAASEPRVEPIRALPALEISGRLQRLSAESLVGLVSSAAGSPDGALGFMDGCLTVSENDKNDGVRHCALVALLQLLTLHRHFVEEFVAEKLHQRINLKRPELLNEALSLFIPIASIHPEFGLDKSIINCLRLHPRKVLRLFSISSAFFSNDNIDWAFIDALFLNADFLISRNLARSLLSIFYSLISRSAPSGSNGADHASTFSHAVFTAEMQLPSPKRILF